MDFEQPPQSPVDALRSWLEDAQRIDRPNPNSMTLATIEPDGTPSARVVLLKGLDDRGVVFYSNRESRKGRALEAHPVAALALVLHWDRLERQVAIEGPVTLVDDAESDAYFATRPRVSQLGAWASRQSEPVADRAALDAAYKAMEERFAGGEVPRPPHWGGYRVALQRVEFWQSRPARLHDRIVYEMEGAGSWRAQRLFP
jgi:pyridoxamine 5'-phosphate oxidase